MNSRCFNLIAFIPSRSNRQILANFSKGLYPSSGKEKENRNVLGAFHLSRNSGNSGRDVYGNTFSGRSTLKFLGWNFGKVPFETFRWKCLFHLRIIISYRLFRHGDICATVLNFGDESINESNLSQMAHVIHSIDLFMDRRFRKVLVNMENASSTNVLHKACN